MLRLNLNKVVARNNRKTSKLLTFRSPSQALSPTRKQNRDEKNKKEPTL